MTGDARPLGTPVGYQQLKQGDLIMAVAAGSAEAANLVKDGRCSLLVQPITYPARNVASVALQGTAQQLEEGSADAVSSSSSSSGSPAVTSFKLTIDSCVYYGGLDHVSTTTSSSSSSSSSRGWGGCLGKNTLCNKQDTGCW
jgi:hypothetical protein